VYYANGRFTNVKIFNGTQISSSNLVAQWKLTKPLIGDIGSVDFPHSDISVTAYAVTTGTVAQHRYVFTGLDFSNYSYILRNPETDKAFAVTGNEMTVGDEYACIGDGMLLTARQWAERDDAYMLTETKALTVNVSLAGSSSGGGGGQITNTAMTFFFANGDNDNAVKLLRISGGYVNFSLSFSLNDSNTDKTVTAIELKPSNNGQSFILLDNSKPCYESTWQDNRLTGVHLPVSVDEPVEYDVIIWTTDSTGQSEGYIDKKTIKIVAENYQVSSIAAYFYEPGTTTATQSLTLNSGAVTFSLSISIDDAAVTIKSIELKDKSEHVYTLLSNGQPVSGRWDVEPRYLNDTTLNNVAAGQYSLYIGTADGAEYVVADAIVFQ
jgi:hypothetical protein